LPTRLGLSRAILVISVLLMALTPVLGTVSATFSPDTYANAKAYYGHQAPDTTSQQNSTQSRDSSRAVKKFFDISVSLGWDASFQDFSDWQSEITGTSKKLYDGTDGQMAFRKVDIYNNKDHWDNVNVHINNGNGRAYTYRGGISYSGVFIEEYKNDLGMGGKVLQHEFGHYGLGLPDEYTDSHGPFCKCTQGTTYDTDEWCAQSNHCTYDWSFCHDQGNGEAKSCWEQLVQYYPVLTVKNPPTAGPYDAPTPTFVWHFPDLSTSSNSIKITPENPKAGDTVTVSVDISNKENLVRKNVDVSFSDETSGTKTDLGTRSYYIDAYTSTVTYSWTVTGGTHTISALIDPGNVIREIDENNNTAILTFHVNAPPVISSNLKELRTKEDQPLIVDLSKFESDQEDGQDNASLKWTVSEKDTKVITKVTGENSIDDLLSFYTPLYWHGKTTVQLTLTDSVGLKVNKDVDLYWDFVNHNPWVDSIVVTTTSIFRTEATSVTITVKDVEDKTIDLKPQVQFKAEKGEVWLDLPTNNNVDSFEAPLVTDANFIVGLYDIRAKVTDSGGLLSDWSYLNGSLEVQNNLPEVQQLVFADGITAVNRTQPVTLFITATDKETPTISLKPFLEASPCGMDDWQQVDTEPMFLEESWAITFIVPIDANIDTHYCFQAYVLDEQDDSSVRYLSNELIIQNNAPLVTSIEAVEKSVLRTKNIVVTVKGGDIEDRPSDLKLEINYQLGSGNWEGANIEGISFQPSSSQNGTWTARFAPPKSMKLGDYTFSARLTDKNAKVGAWHFQPTLIVAVKNNLPTSVIVPLKQMTAGQGGIFDSLGSKDLEDTGLTYTWDFGDQKSSKGPRVNHAYSSQGKYTVTLTVTDSDGGKATTTAQVSVKSQSIIPGGGAGGSASSLYLIVALLLIVVIVIVLVVIVSHRKKVRAKQPLPPALKEPEATTTTQDQAPMYKVEAYRVYDQNIVKEKVYGDEEKERAYK
jgi:hypothetical protein